MRGDWLSQRLDEAPRLYDAAAAARLARLLGLAPEIVPPAVGGRRT
jgi:hypothetical protein